MSGTLGIIYRGFQQNLPDGTGRLKFGPSGNPFIHRPCLPCRKVLEGLGAADAEACPEGGVENPLDEGGIVELACNAPLPADPIKFLGFAGFFL
jgi:hypothetical protein